MSSLNDAKMSTLKDKHLAQEAEVKAAELEAQAEVVVEEKATEDAEVKKGKGRRIKSRTKN